VTNGRVRLFVALELSSEVRAALAGWGAVVAAECDGRAVDVAGLHVTLCFLGSHEAARIDAFAAALNAAAGLPAVTLRAGAVLCLPPRRPRVVALGLGDADGFADVHAAVAGGLAATGAFEPEARPFLPHVTVVRIRTGMRGGRRVRPEALPPPPEVAGVGEAVTLFRSHLGPGGSRYEALRTVRLISA
jgi:2'-5' RNA ligase